MSYSKSSKRERVSVASVTSSAELSGGWLCVHETDTHTHTYRENDYVRDTQRESESEWSIERESKREVYYSVCVWERGS